MKKIYAFLSFLGLIIILLPLSGYGQCSNTVTVTAGGLGVRSVGNTTTFSYCPDGQSPVIVSGSSTTSNTTLTWTATSNGTTTIVPSTKTSDNNGTYSTISVSPASNSTYTLTSISSCQNGSTNSASVIIAPALDVSASSSSVCSGGAVTLTATGSSTNKYTWSGPGLTTTTTPGTLTVNPTATTTYTVTAPTSCGTSVQQITVDVKSVTVSPSAPFICTGGQSTVLTASYSGATGATYQWATTAAPGTPLSSTASLTVAPGSTTTYQVTVSTTDCNTIVHQVTVTVGTATVTLSPTATTICSGNSTTLTASSTNPATTYRWANQATPNSTLSTTSTANVNPTTTTTYQVTSITCNISTTQTVVVSVATQTASASPTSTAVCSGSSATLTASSNISNATYEWYVGASSATQVVSIARSLTVSPTATTTYRVVITASCNSSFKDIPVTVNPSPVAGVTPATTTTTSGSPVTLTASGGNTYAWTGTTNGNTTPLSQTTATITVTPTATTTYTVTATTTPNGCSNSATSTVTVTGGSALPVELLRFEAAWVDQSPVLTWATASEKNSSHFKIERSSDGRIFQTVGQTTGAGSTTAQTNYRFIDATPIKSAVTPVYYRLQQVDENGAATYSPVRSVMAPVGLGTFQAVVFPNPVEQTATVRFRTNSIGSVTLVLRNVLGQTVLTQIVPATTGAQEITLSPTSSWPVGIYYLTLRQGTTQQVLQLSHR